jgi:hypothetical protein
MIFVRKTRLKATPKVANIRDGNQAAYWFLNYLLKQVN